MRAAKRWLLAAPDKVPYYISGQKRHGRLDTPADLEQLATYEDAQAALSTRGPAWLLGFALGKDDSGGCLQGIDLDDIEANELAELANGLPGYVEASPSGEGVHAIGYGRQFKTLGANGSGIEAYAAGRFFTVTEQVIRDGELVCLADHVERVLTSRHQSHRRSSPSAALTSGATVQVSPKVVAELRSALNHMRSDDYGLWIETGHALKPLGDTGRGLWLDWSATSPKFNPQEAAAKWDSFAPALTGYQAVFAKAQQRGWINPASNAAQIGQPSGPETRVGSARSLIFRSLSDVIMRAIDWLWTGWIPKGYITLFAGETGAGKSTVLADIAARVTTGAPWPGEPAGNCRDPGRVLWLGSEDGTEEMTVPRLKACGADLSKMIEIRGVAAQGGPSTFSMQDDLQLVAERLADACDEGDPFNMLVIDPVTSYLPGQRLKKVDLNDAGQLRSILEPWLRLAQEYNIAIVCVTHFAKDTTRSMLHRVLGSAAFAQTCRSLCAVIERPVTDGDPRAAAHAKALVQVKVNLPEHPGGAWKFNTAKVQVGVDPCSGKPIHATRPEWEMLDSAFTLHNAVGKARGPVSRYEFSFGSWLHATFAAQPDDEWLPLTDVKSKALSEHGVSESWWDKNSRRYLAKQNVGGKWKCRPKSTNDETLHSGGNW